MKNKTMIFLASWFVLSAAWAGDDARQDKIARILEAQGLEQTFQQQLERSNTSARDVGESVYRTFLLKNAGPDGKANPLLEGIFRSYLERSARLFSARELVNSYASYYGLGMSDADLDAVLAYYTSSVGRRDTASSQAAMAGFSDTMAAEGEKRLNASIGRLMFELKAATAR